MIQRRLVTIPRTALIWVVLTLALPLLIPAAVLVDLTRQLATRKPWIAIRLVFMAWVYLTAQIAVIVVAAAQWLASLVYGRRAAERRGEWSYWLQAKWVSTIMAAMTWAFQLSFEVKGGDVVAPGPIVVLFRHASIMDNLLPHVFVSAAAGIRLRWVLKKELLSDPALDIGGNRMPNYFVDRDSDDPAEERANIAALGADLGVRDGVMLFPEGTRFGPQRRRRRMADLRESSPDLYELLAPHELVLPPRTGGVLALLDSGADVVVAAHAGFEAMRGIKEVWTTAPVGRTVALSFRRIDSADIPEGYDERRRWLFETWAWVGEEVSTLQDGLAS
ncbi:MAG: 1-acyl-sn-glycerol-3-phosphate acyltransferase [Acidimicrobiia bacterium]|nr:1-acyl-sn-glycerol-3-phosphate acyltransferase [Acidimicrobiia bacterium]